MKRIIEIILLTSILSITAGCSKDPEVCIDCATFSFKQTYLKYSQNEEIFYIKGVALNVSKHGREIKIVEDLKGNLGGKSSIFVWGMSSISFCDDKGRQDMRIDDITQYSNNDTLIMLIGKARKRFNGDIERPSDYATLGNAYSSVIKLSNGYVTGYYINHWGVPVLWEDLQKELDILLNMDEKPSWWSDEYIPDPFNIVYKGIHNNYFFIKGLVLDSYQDYGKKIQIITDLKGNFPKENTSFNVWGANDFQFDNVRLDNLRLYNRQDTLLILLYPVSSTEEILSKGIEKTGDYATLNRTFSILRLSNNFVSGYITSCYEGEQVISWEEFQVLLTQLNR